MAKKCSICKEKIETIFLEKIKGTQIGKDYVCSSCQKKYKDKVKEMLK
jgi:protein-arginine kinase activator protein McsA